MSAPTKARRERIAGHVRDEDFRHRAACRDGNAELFFPTAERGPEHDAQIHAAKAVCAGCPVLAPCREWALSSLAHGIAGGMTEVERRRERALRRGRHGDCRAPQQPATAVAQTTTTSSSRSAEEGSAGGNRAPLRISHTHALTGTRAAEGHRS